tara:strand:+ start:2093 stop:4081 length:1989 start_codon:yes stop_codon:yes gene_type:complete
MNKILFISIYLFNSGNCFVFNGLKSNKIKLNLKMNELNDLNNYNPSKIINNLVKTSKEIDQWSINEFFNEVKNKHVEGVTIIADKNNNINGLVAIDSTIDIKNENLHFVESGVNQISDVLLNTILNNDIAYDVIHKTENYNVGTIFLNVIGIYILLNVLGLVLQNIDSNTGFSSPFNNNMMGGTTPNLLKNSNNELISRENINTNFSDVAGCDEAKNELEEIVDFFKDPEKFTNAGAKVPKGVLLEGPPGTGKTLLARALAGQANVSFISVSASEFVQMFVGLGASRVRDLFNNARQNSPCIIFIDEIDAIGRNRGGNMNSGGNEEREQTLNQILTNMDGFDKLTNVVVLAATNRADILDKALTRSGRFDRKVKVGLPNIENREKILKVHLRNKKVDNETDFSEISKLTSGFSGADIENMANEAVILALRNETSIINTNYLIKAFEKITIGLPLNTTKKLNENNLVSYHEAGHTLTACLFKEFFNVVKVTTQSNTNGAGGYTLFTTNEYYNNYPTKKYYLAYLIVTMAGRAGEIVYNNKINKNVLTNYDNLFNDKNLDITTGASSDIKQATKISKDIIKQFGLRDNDNIIFMDNNNILSESSKMLINNEINNLINDALKKAIAIIEKNIDNFNNIAIKLKENVNIDEKYLKTLDINYLEINY